MTFSEKYDKVLTGLISGFVFPFIVGLIIYLFSAGHHITSFISCQDSGFKYYYTFNNFMCFSEYSYFSDI